MNMDAKEKLAEAKKQLELLKKDLELYNIKEQLSHASSIKKHIAEDVSISKACEQDSSLAKDRGQLFDELKTIQDNILAKVLGEKEDENEGNYDNTYIHNFTEAKKELAKLVDEELHQQAFADELLKTTEEFNIHCKSLQSVSNKCSNDNYTLLLMGEYQTGKTTTLDTLCDGRHIGEIGSGIVTSAVPLYISYAEHDKVDVIWKTPDELKQLFVHVGGHIDDFDYNTFNIADDSQRSSLLIALDNYRTTKDCPKVGDEARYLSLCSIVLKYYGTPALESQKSQRIHFSDIPRITKFPSSIETRWYSDGVEQFKIEESVFVFISKVECGYPSHTLKEIRSTIIDCPGLFANKYDTEVTMNALTDADAIIFMLPYYAEAGENIRTSLGTLKKKYPDVLRKLILVNNISSAATNSNFADKNVETAKGILGDGITIVKFDALLSYLGMIRKSYSKGSLTDFDIQHFVEDTKRKVEDRQRTGKETNNTRRRKEIIIESFSDAWKYRSRPFYLDEDVCVEDIIEEGGLYGLVNNILMFVEKNRAYSLIYAKGVSLLKTELNGMRNSMISSYIEPYMSSRENRIKQWQERSTKLKEFEEKKMVVVNNVLFDSTSQPSLEKRLTNGIYSKLFSDNVYNDMINRICSTLYENKGTLFKKCMQLKKSKSEKEAELKSFITPLIEEDITAVIKDRVNYWNSLLSTNQDDTYNSIFIPAVSQIESELKLEWKQIYAEDKIFKNRMNDFITISRSTEKFFTNAKKESADLSSVGRSNVFKALLADISLAITGIASLIASYICFLFLSALASGVAVANPIGLMVALIVFLSGGIFVIFKGPDAVKKAFIEKMAVEIRKKLQEENFFDKIRNIVSAENSRLLSSYSSSIQPNKEKFENEKTLATQTSETEIEKNCFTAAEIIEIINNQMVVYDGFISKYVGNKNS